jgi:hypothetical protein
MKAKIIADGRGVTVAEYISEIVRPTIDRDWVKARKNLDEEDTDSA